MSTKGLEHVVDEKVAVICGGRGAASWIIKLQSLGLKVDLLINGFDDGQSTGEIRRLFRGILGPSDFRKNWSTIMSSSGLEQAAHLLERRCESDDLRRLEGEVEQEMNSADGISKEFWDTFHDDLALGIDSIDALAVPSFEVAVGNVLIVGIWLSVMKDFDAVLERINQFNEGTRVSMYSVSGRECVHLSNECISDFRGSEWEIIDSCIVPENVDLRYRDCSGVEVPLTIGTLAKQSLSSANVAFLSSGTPLSSLVPTLEYFSATDCGQTDLIWIWNRSREPSTECLNSAEYEDLFATFVSRFRTTVIITERTGVFQPMSAFKQLEIDALEHQIFFYNDYRSHDSPPNFGWNLAKALIANER